MYFKRLEMHGFKSFAEPVVIEFHEGVTAIVGPNGSGKSNISDAIRWVLGEQSPKALRGGKMEEVIFAGTASRKSRGMAEVTLVIDNSTGILDIDYNEVAITRRMYRSGESEYLINGNQCRLRDIRELIMDTGIGVDGYSIIGQGKIADIVSNKPESRREIFEEAAGVVMYKSKKAEAERKLTAAAGNLERVDDIVGEIEGRIDGLREDSAKAKEYLTLKDRYRDLEINITLKNIDSILSKNQIYREDIARLEKEAAEIAAEKQAVDEEVASGRERSGNLEQLGNEARDRLLQIVEKINHLTSQNQLDQERLGTMDKDQIRLASEIETLTDKLEKEEHNRKELEKSKGEIQLNYEKAEQILRDKTLEHSRLAEEAARLSETIDRGRDELFQLHSRISAKRSEARSYESILTTLTRRKEQLLADAESAERDNATGQAQLAEVTAEQATLHRTLAEMDSQLARYGQEKEKQEKRRKDLTLTIEDLKLQGSQKTARKKTIEEMENNYEGYNYAVKYIMRAGLAGIKGVVADLMRVPEGYETAVETALGGQMQNVVCDTDSHAKAAVNLLKEKRAGRLTFLPVASIKSGRTSVDPKIAGDSGYLGLAADCIEYAPEYEQIFRYLLGRVAVTRDMDTAIRLSKAAGASLRFVTLEGEIINASGAITGGKYKNKTANLLERKGEISRLEEEIGLLRVNLRQAMADLEQSNQKLENLTRESGELERRRREQELQAATLDSRVAVLTENLNAMEEGSRKYDRELTAIEKEYGEAQQLIASLEKEAEDGEKQVVLRNAQVEQALTDYEEKKSVTDSASEEITRARISANEWDNKRENMETLLSRITETAEDYRFQKEEKQRALTRLDGERNEILFGRGNTQKDMETLLKEKDETETYIQQVDAERKAIQEKITQVSGAQQTQNERLNACRDQKYQMEIKAAKNETQLDTLKERLWTDFEISYAQARDLQQEDFVLSASVKESREIRNRLRELGDVNVGAIAEYESVSQRYNFLTAQRKDILTAVEELKGIISDMDTTIKGRFKETFDQVVENFEIIFRELFGGGHAELRMEVENDPLGSGIDIIAQPPGKKLQNINLMSGGEKTMTAIALMFAVLKTKPTPFCILDEVEAALDDANIDRFARYLRKFQGIQFALVTHQKATMEHADVLYGVTMPEQGVSKVLSLRLGDDFDL